MKCSATTALLICVFCAAATRALPFTILNPWTGRVEFSLEKSASEDNRVAASAAIPDVYPGAAARAAAAEARSDEEKQVLFETRDEISEYLTPDGKPKYKVIKYSPYGHTRG